MATHTYTLAINYNAGGQFATNVLHYQFDDVSYGTTAQAGLALLNAWDAAVKAAWLNMLSIHVTLLSIKSRALNVSGGFEAIKPYAAGVVGARAGNMMAAGVGPVIILVPTGNAKQRGRIFLPGCSDTDVADGILSAAYFAILGTNMVTALTPITLAGGGAPVATPVIYSRKPAPVSRTIFASYPSPMIGEQRRRQLPV
jgi:hypothetical protein